MLGGGGVVAESVVVRVVADPLVDYIVVHAVSAVQHGIPMLVRAVSGLTCRGACWHDRGGPPSLGRLNLGCARRDWSL